MVSWYPPEAYGYLHEDIEEVLFTADDVQERVRELGEAISRDYAGRDPLLVGVLKGVMFFMADLLRDITIPVEVDFLSVSSYSPETRKKGFVRLVKDLEDEIDTGLTLVYLLRTLQARGPASLEVCVLFNKPKHRLIDIPAKYVGIDLPDRFVVGYGLDHRERYRNLPFVALLKPEALR
jgi:hypoxanthine phosphoribosyltransferase